MRTGVFTVSMPEYTPQEAVDILKKLGYDGVEWRVARAEPSDGKEIPFEQRYWKGNKCTLELDTIREQAPQIRELCDKNGIAVLALTTYLRPHEHQQIEKVLEAADIMGCDKIRVFPPDYTEKENSEVLLNRMREDVKVLEGLAKKYHKKIVFEIHMDNIMASASAARRILDGTDAAYLGVILDPGNMVYEGFENYKKCFEILGNYIAHIHIKNGYLAPCGEDEMGVSIWQRVWSPLKKGSADLKKFFGVMHEMGYQGDLSVEDFSNEENTYDKLLHNLEYIRYLLAKEQG